MNIPQLSELKQSATMKLDALRPKLHHMMESANSKLEVIKQLEAGQLMQSTTDKVKSTTKGIRSKIPVFEHGLFKMSLRTTAYIISILLLIFTLTFLQSLLEYHNRMKSSLLEEDISSYRRQSIVAHLEDATILIVIGVCLLFVNVFLLVGVLKERVSFMLPGLYIGVAAAVWWSIDAFLAVLKSDLFGHVVGLSIFVYSVLIINSYIKQIKAPSQTNNIYSEQLISPDSILVTDEEKNNLKNEYSPESNTDVPLIHNMIKPTDSCIA